MTKQAANQALPLRAVPAATLWRAEDYRPGTYEVYVDGVERPLCFEADADAGLARCHVAGEFEGSLARDANGALRVVTVRGKVEIRAAHGGGLTAAGD